jgi:hypothetical protein
MVDRIKFLIDGTRWCGHLSARVGNVYIPLKIVFFWSNISVCVCVLRSVGTSHRGDNTSATVLTLRWGRSAPTAMVRGPE